MGSPVLKRVRRLHPASRDTSSVAPAAVHPGQVFLKHLHIAGFKTFRESQSIDLCPGWSPVDGPGKTTASPLTIVLGGNGAGKSSVFDAVLFVLGQSSKSIRSSGGSAQLVNDQSVLQEGLQASASVTITFQKCGECQGMETESDNDLPELSVECRKGSDIGNLQELSVGRSVKHTRGTSTYSLQGNVCSKENMIQELNAFVGTDMGDVDRYVLRQGSTMVCRREGKELLSFIEHLAGTAKLQGEIEEVQKDLDCTREEALSLEADVQTSVRTRKQLQPQVDAFFVYQRDTAENQQEKAELWHRKLAFLRVRLVDMEVMAAKNEKEATELGGKIKSSEDHFERAERNLARAARSAEKALRSQSNARGKLQQAKSAQAETEAFLKKIQKSIRSKTKNLTRAHKILEEGDEDIAKLSVHASELDSTSSRMKVRLDELQTDQEQGMPKGKGSDKREELLRELTMLETGPLPELESALAEKELNFAESSRVMTKMLSDLSTARLEVDRTDGVAASSQTELMRLRDTVKEVNSELAKLRLDLTSQQALIGDLEARRTRQISNGTDAPEDSSAPLRGENHPGRYLPKSDPGSSFSKQGRGRLDALRSIVEKLRGGGVGAHGVLADLVLVRRQRDEPAVTAVLGSTIRNTVVVQTRKDGARVVAEARTAGVSGQIRCDVLDEIKAKFSAETGIGKGGNDGLSPLSQSVTTPDPLHFPVAAKHLRGWLLADTRQAAWRVRSASSKSNAFNVVTASGELFYAHGEVAVKASQKNDHAPGLGVVQGGRSDSGWQDSALQQVGTQQQVNPAESKQDLDRRMKEAVESLSAAETRIADLTRADAKARFDWEDAQIRNATAETKAKECRWEVTRMEQKVSAQRRLVLAASASGCKDSTENAADEDQLESLRKRRDDIIAELAELGESASDSQDSARQRARTAAIMELRKLTTDLDKHRELRNEVEVKLRVLKKRGKARRNRVETLTSEKNDCEKEQTSTKASQSVYEEKITILLSKLEETQSTYRVKREEAREAEGAMRNARRELSALHASWKQVSGRQDKVNADLRKAQADSSQIAQCLANFLHPVAQADEPSPEVQEEAGGAASRLVREFEEFLRLQSTNESSEVNGVPGSSGGGSDSAQRHETCGKGKREKEQDAQLQGQGRDTAAATPLKLGAEDEMKVAKFVHLLKSSREDRDFLRETGIMEASIRLNETNLKKRHEAIDPGMIDQAIRLDWDAVKLGRDLVTAQESVVDLMDKKEMLEANRHATLVKCLKEVNEALGGIYRRLTSVEGPGCGTTNQLESGKIEGKFRVRSVPGGDCFLRFSLERTLLLSEGLAVQVKPEPASPWRSPGSLSGGQVALVGLALNLATQAVRPAPLYLMDEIDAALDTHKVRRVAAMLADRARSGNEQCIVISHRPEMHERGSHLVGVYHCEGTARTVSLELLPQQPLGEGDIRP